MLNRTNLVTLRSEGFWGPSGSGKTQYHASHLLTQAMIPNRASLHISPQLVRDRRRLPAGMAFLIDDTTHAMLPDRWVAVSMCPP